MRKVIFLDRDGVLNEDVLGSYITEPQALKIFPGVVEGLKILQGKGYALLMVSNQAGIGDGIYSREGLESVTRTLVQHLAFHGLKFDGIYYCLHGKNEACSCRKPRIGLFQRACLDFDIDRRLSYFIGDKLSDVEAGKQFGVRVIMVRTGHGFQEEQLLRLTRPDFLVSDFTQAVKVVVSEAERAWRK